MTNSVNNTRSTEKKKRKKRKGGSLTSDTPSLGEKVQRAVYIMEAGVGVDDDGFEIAEGAEAVVGAVGGNGRGAGGQHARPAGELVIEVGRSVGNDADSEVYASDGLGDVDIG